MLKTRLCSLLKIEYPIIQAPIVPYTSPELIAAVCNAGGLGSIGTVFRTLQNLREDITRVRELTDKPFAVNHTMRTFDEEAFSLTLKAKPALISMSLGDPGDLVKRAHDAGILFMHQIHSVEEAIQAADRGVDIIVAQGGEAGGYSENVGTIALVPQVVDAVSPVLVVAAGGIVDGRGLAAALMLGAQGVNLGSRFVASVESMMSAVGKDRVVKSKSEDTLKAKFMDTLFPPPANNYPVEPRLLSTAFVREWNEHPETLKENASRLQVEVKAAIQNGRLDELMPMVGQGCGLIRDILPAAEIVTTIIKDAEKRLLDRKSSFWT